MPRYLAQPLRLSSQPSPKAHARLLALVVALSLGSLHAVTALAQVVPATSGSVTAPPANTVSVNEGETKVPDVARRLWRDLLCTCPEKDCVHESLDACTCHYAEKRRGEILDEVKRRGFGSTKQDDATYATVFANYIKAHGEAADGSRPPRQSSAPIWIEIALIAGAVASAVAMITWMVDRFRRRPLSVTTRAEGVRPNRRKRNIRKRR